MAEANRLLILAIVAGLAIVGFMTIGLAGNVAFVLELRGMRLAGLVQVAVSIAISTVLFQTVTANRILTPSIMGLDAVYLFCQTALVLALGGFGYAGLDERLRFVCDVGLMLGLALALIVPMLRRRIDMSLMLLSGVVLAILFRSLTSLLARLIDPNDFAVVQMASFASFSAGRPDLLALGAAVTLIAGGMAWRARHLLDVLALGPDMATGLGVVWIRRSTGLLVLVCVLVSVSTALAGPVAFLGLLVVALAERIAGTRRHAVLIPAAALTSIIVLVGGQTLLQHAFATAVPLGVIIEGIGGVVFLLLLMKAARA